MMMPPPPPVPMPRAMTSSLAPSAAAAAGGVTILAPPPAPPQDLSAAGQRATKRQRHAAAPSWLLPPPPLASRVAAPVPADDDTAAPSSSSTNPFGNRACGGGGIIEAVNALGPPLRPDASPRATATVALTRISNGTAKRAWEDVVPGGVSQLVASRRFAACATGGSPLEGGGALVLWSRAGRRLAPPLSLSAPIVHLATDDDDDGDGDDGDELGGGKSTGDGGPQQQRGWRLLAVTADGGVHCWDVRARSLTLRTSLVPLLAVASASAAEAAAAAAASAATSTTTAATAADATAAVAPLSSSSAPPVGLVSARLCRATGAPTVVLSDFSAAVFDMGLGGWARVADGVSSSSANAAASVSLPKR